MKFVNSRTLSVLVLVIYVAALVAMVVYAFSHSKQANFGLAVLALIGPLVVMFVNSRHRQRHHSFGIDPLKSHMGGIIIGFAIAFIMFAMGAFSIPEPEGQLLFAIGPFAFALVALVGYVGDKISKARREEQLVAVANSRQTTKV